MRDLLALRFTWVFAGLVIATCTTWWLGSESGLTGGERGLAATLTIVIAFAKIFFIGQEFMELRSAPMMLRAVFYGWVCVVAGAAITLVVV